MFRIGTLALALAAGSLSSCAGRDEGEPAPDRGSASFADLPGEDQGSDDRGELSAQDGADGAEPVYQTEDEARAQDLQVIADAQGWTFEEAQTYQDQGDALGLIAQQVADERPEQFVGGALGPEPGDVPRLYIKGSADDWLRGLVAAAPFEIRLVEGQPYSFAELSERIAQLTQLLRSLGYSNFGVSANIEREGLLEAQVTRAPGAPSSTVDLVARLPAEFQTGVSITLVDEPVFVLE